MVVTPAYRFRLSTKAFHVSKPLTNYFLGNDSEEVSRLNRQYIFHKNLFDYPQLIPPEIDITHVSRVIDVGAGTGAWALDFVSLPDVCDRDLQVFACDISTAKFPRSGEPEVRKITFFQQDVTKPFPDELLGTFDLINLSCLSYALTAQGWKVALRNILAVEAWRTSPRTGWRSYHIQSRDSSATRGSRAQYRRVITGHIERCQHQSHLCGRSIETWLRGRTFLSFTKDARGSLLYGSIFQARLCAVWKLLRLLQWQERDAPVGTQGFQYRELHADVEYDNDVRNERRALEVS